VAVRLYEAIRGGGEQAQDAPNGLYQALSDIERQADIEPHAVC